jgi:hypothetical protein
MIVVFKSGAPLSVAGLDLGQPAVPISAVESRRYLIYSITIIKYNIKASGVRTYFGMTGLNG